MRRVFRFSFDFDATNIEFDMPAGARIINAAFSKAEIGRVDIRAVIDTRADKVRRYFVLYATGERIEDNAEHIATLEGSDNTWWHIFEVIR